MAAGLGNPGPAYADTRHNIGFRVLDRVAAQAATQAWSLQGLSFVAPARLPGHSLLLIKPQTYMNRSGLALRELFGGGPPPGPLVVVHDDLDLPFGRLRLRPGGGHGGHNGIRSLIEELGSDAFYRIKCGIGRPPEGMEVADYVLSPFSAEELPALPEFVDRASQALGVLIAEGLEEAMRRFHTRT